MPNLGRVDPRSLPNLFAWYDASYINGFFNAQPAADAAIAQWNDLSGNGRHLVQGTGANQPLYRVTAGPNGGNSVNFVDATDTMQVAAAGTQLRPVTVVAVLKNTLADDAALHKFATFNATRIGVGLDWLTANAFCGIDDNVAQVGATVAGDITTYHVCSFVAQPVGGFSIGGVDGTHLSTAGAAGTNTNLNVDVGSIGHVSELIIYLNEVPRPLMFSLEQSLAEKWGVFTTYKIGA
jgi:hypothetical protein